MRFSQHESRKNMYGKKHLITNNWSLQNMFWKTLSKTLKNQIKKLENFNLQKFLLKKKISKVIIRGGGVRGEEEKNISMRDMT